jgi:hypothetical protein
MDYESTLHLVAVDLRDALRYLDGRQEFGQEQLNVLLAIISPTLREPSEDTRLAQSLQTLRELEPDMGETTNSRLSPASVATLQSTTVALEYSYAAHRNYSVKEGRDSDVEGALEDTLWGCVETFQLVATEVLEETKTALVETLRRSQPEHPLGIEDLAVTLRHIQDRRAPYDEAVLNLRRALENEFPQLDDDLMYLRTREWLPNATMPLESFQSVLATLTATEQRLIEAGFREFVESGSEILPPERTIASDALHGWVDHIGGIVHQLWPRY